MVSSFQSFFWISPSCWYTSCCSSADRSFQLASMLPSKGAVAFERVDVTVMAGEAYVLADARRGAATAETRARDLNNMAEW